MRPCTVRPRGVAIAAGRNGHVMPDTFSLPHLPGPDRMRCGFWLVFGLPWPDGHVTVAEAAYAVAAPAAVAESRGGGPRMGGCPARAGRGAAAPGVSAFFWASPHAWTELRHPGDSVVWFSELTRWLDTLGLTCERLGLDWHRALDTLQHGRLPGVLLGVDQRTHAVLCDASRDGLTVVHPDGRHERVTDQERARRRGRMRELLTHQPGPAAAEPGRSPW
jgi:hypothetical protein